MNTAVFGSLSFLVIFIVIYLLKKKTVLEVDHQKQKRYEDDAQRWHTTLARVRWASEEYRIGDCSDYLFWDRLAFEKQMAACCFYYWSVTTGRLVDEALSYLPDLTGEIPPRR